MPSTNSKIESLAKILRQEQANDYRDSTVIGGLDRFLQQSAAELEPLLGDVKSYSALTPPQRETWTSAVLARLAKTVSPHSAVEKATRRVAPTRPRSPTQALSLDDDVTRLKGVAGRSLPKLKKLGVQKIRHLVYLFPHRHNDYASIAKISDLEPGPDKTIVATVWESSERNTGPRRRSSEAVLGDDTGNVRAFWFNNPYMAKTLRPGAQVALSGRVNVFRGQLTFESPEYELLGGQEELVHTGRLVPVYPSTEGLAQRTIRGLVKRSLDACLSQVDEFLPGDLLDRTELLGLRNAIDKMHYPDSSVVWNAARRRLAFDELFLLQYAVLERRRDWRDNGEGVSLSGGREALDAFLESLPFKLTPAQNRVLDEIMGDVRSERPMARMLQGEVGSGKTVVAAAALLVAALNGHQGALMAPTEILAEQHFITLGELLSGLPVVSREDYTVSVEPGSGSEPVTIGLLLGSMRKRVKEEMHDRVAAGAVDILIGTHAIIQSSVDFPSLALVVVDEQQRFGVMQRSSLREKGVRPHLLAMSATPIPRSLALTLYGDLDMSVIDELPPGRQEIRTRWMGPDRRDVAYNFVRKQVGQGRQAFIVCPLIEESESIQARAANVEHERLSTEVFPDLRLGLLHGRMALAATQRVLAAFKKGDLDILVSTPVVEVGIDIPNATVMLIDGAERFGLAQLHQFRGRVGRGEHESFCLLLTEAAGNEARERVRTVERVSDGFQLAEEDLKLRGPGDYLGTRQSGLPDLRVARLTDQDILSLARKEAARILESDPELSDQGHAPLRKRLEALESEAPGEMS
ncbi:MAG: ATP-dependent DNA helicase RecG [Chloroflexi bacterium]|nr:ATP-dependent DNA helicase RecG [Chloroflexota bacterium]